MASVSANYAEVFVDGGSAASSSQQSSSGSVTYSQVRSGGAVAERRLRTGDSESTDSDVTTISMQPPSARPLHQQQQPLQSQGQHIQLQQSHFTQGGGGGGDTTTTITTTTTNETQLSDRIVGYGYQNYAIEENQEQQSGKKDSKFGQFRRSFGRGKKARLPTGYASNFASGRDVIMKGWLYKQDSGGFHLWKRRWFALRANELYYYKSPKDNGALGKVLLTAEHRIVPTDDNLSKRYSFKIERAGDRVYFLAADDKENLTNWMNAVR